MPLTPGQRLGPYEITAAIGKGGMGEVSRAKDTKLGRDVAVKVLPAAFAQDPERLVRFEREARVLASLNHTNIAHIYGFESAALGAGTSIHFLVMEMVEGEDLAERLRRGAIPIDESIAIAKQIAEGLEEAHEHGIIHRDLKPANVKVTPDGNVKLLDFGLAKAIEGDAGTLATSGSAEVSHSPTMTKQGTVAGMILGTAAYMSPEQARGKKVDKRADIWSFGVVLYEMLTGKRLFTGETVSDVLAAVLTRDPDFEALPRATPPYLTRLLRRCIEKDPRRRLQAIGEARIALDSPVKGGLDAPPPGPADSRRRTLERVVTAAALIVAALALWRLTQSQTAPREVMHLDVSYPRGIEPSTISAGFAVSNDGTTIAMVGVTKGTRKLFLKRLGDPEAVEIPGTDGVNGATFSPDGASLLFLPSTGLVTRLTLADRQRVVVASGADIRGGGLAWSNRGIVFPKGGALWIAPPSGGEPRALTRIDASRHEVSARRPDDPSRRPPRAFFQSHDRRGNRAHRSRLDRGRYANSVDGTRDDASLVQDESPPLRARRRRHGGAVRRTESEAWSRRSGVEIGFGGSGTFGSPEHSPLSFGNAPARILRLQPEPRGFGRP